MILNAYSKEFVGWTVGETLETEHCIHTLRMTLSVWIILPEKNSFITLTEEYISLLKESDITISMTENRNSKINVQVEKVNNAMKNEMLNGKMFYGIKEVTETVEKVVLFIIQHDLT